MWTRDTATTSNCKLCRLYSFIQLSLSEEHSSLFQTVSFFFVLLIAPSIMKKHVLVCLLPNRGTQWQQKNDRWLISRGRTAFLSIEPIAPHSANYCWIGGVHAINLGSCAMDDRRRRRGFTSTSLCACMPKGYRITFSLHWSIGCTRNSRSTQYATTDTSTSRDWQSAKLDGIGFGWFRNSLASSFHWAIAVARRTRCVQHRSAEYYSGRSWQSPRLGHTRVLGSTPYDCILICHCLHSS